MGISNPSEGPSPSLRAEVNDVVLVAAGAIPGALLRWQLDNTLIANLIGCLLIGVINAHRPPRPRLMLLAGIGFCGSITTFSSWILELFATIESSGLLAGLHQLGAGLGGGLAAVALGMGLGLGLGLRR